MFKASKIEGSSPSPSPEVGGDDTGGGRGAGGDEGVFLAHLGGREEDRVRQQGINIKR